MISLIPEEELHTGTAYRMQYRKPHTKYKLQTTEEVDSTVHRHVPLY